MEFHNMLYVIECLVALIAILMISFAIWAMFWYDEVRATIAQKKLLDGLTGLTPINLTRHEESEPIIAQKTEVIQFDTLKQQSTVRNRKQSQYSASIKNT
jgi:hypothetical protein